MLAALLVLSLQSASTSAEPSQPQPAGGDALDPSVVRGAMRWGGAALFGSGIALTGVASSLWVTAFATTAQIARGPASDEEIRVNRVAAPLAVACTIGGGAATAAGAGLALMSLEE